MKNRNQNHSDNWATPDYIYDNLNKEFNFDTDPCPLHADFDGLKTQWGKSVFINPPYSRVLKEAFILKAISHARDGNTCVMLLPASTSTKIFHEAILPNKKEIRFIKGRIKFKGVNTLGEYTETGTPMHDSMIVIF